MNAVLPPRLAFLLVEDQYATRAPIKQRLERDYRKPIIHEAETVQEADARLDEARAKDIRYKIAILDLWVPKDQGWPEHTFDPNLVNRVLPLTARDAVIFHVTAHHEDADFRDILNRRSGDMQRFRESAVSIPMPKERGWTDRLYAAIAEVIHGDRIRERFLRLFGRPEKDLGLVRGRFTATQECDPTLELIALARDIEQNYNHLDPALKQQLQQVFTITPTTEGKYRVSLF
jgi:hypothetical protein